MEQVLEKMRDIIREGGNIVVLAGMNITYDMGLNGVNAEHLAYDVEQKYGYPNDDIETLYAIRRLANYFGNCYVREPSGTGYWAQIKVSYSQTHADLVIPISFSITRVEGGA